MVSFSGETAQLVQQQSPFGLVEASADLLWLHHALLGCWQQQILYRGWCFRHCCIRVVAAAGRAPLLLAFPSRLSAGYASSRERKMAFISSCWRGRCSSGGRDTYGLSTFSSSGSRSRSVSYGVVCLVTVLAASSTCGSDPSVIGMSGGSASSSSLECLRFRWRFFFFRLGASSSSPV